VLLPLSRRSLLFLCTIYGVSLLLVVKYHDALSWSFTNLQRYLDGKISGTTRDDLLIREAKDALEQGDCERARAYAKKTLEYDPYVSTALQILADLELDTGNLQKALEYLEAIIAFRPDKYLGYIGIARIHLQQQRPDEAKRILQQGIDHHRWLISRQMPKIDHTVADRFNRKARRIHADLQRHLRKLEKELCAIIRSEANAFSIKPGKGLLIRYERGMKE